MLTLHRDNSKYHKKEKYKRDIQRPGFLKIQSIVQHECQTRMTRVLHKKPEYNTNVT